MSKDGNIPQSELVYLPPPTSAELYREEGLKEKLLRKTKENPFVPIGVLVTAGALGFGLKEMKAGRSRNSQKLMRLRIFGQGFTVVALLAGVMYGTTGKQK